MPTFWHVDIGSVFELLGTVVTLALFHRDNIKRASRINFKVSLMWKHFCQEKGIVDTNDRES
jgi:hypothetical protein